MLEGERSKYRRRLDIRPQVTGVTTVESSVVRPKWKGLILDDGRKLETGWRRRLKGSPQAE